MNGLNKKTNWRYLFITLIIIYGAITIIMALFVLNINTIYEYHNEQRVMQIKEDIHVLLENNPADMIQKIETYSGEQHFEIALVYQNNKIMQTVDSSVAFNNLPDVMNPYTLFYMSSYQDEGYHVWVAVYKSNVDVFFKNILYLIISFTIIITIVIFLLTFIVSRYVINNLKKLRDNIFKLKQYRLNDIITKNPRANQDVLTTELEQFTKDLQGKFGNFNVQYSALELELQAKQAETQDTIEVVQGLIHDIKGPLKIEEMYIEQLMEGTTAKDKQILIKMRDNNNYLFQEVVDVLHVFKNQQDYLTTIETFDLLMLLQQTLKHFAESLKQHNIYYYIEAPKEVKITANKILVKQIVTNIISNVCKYGQKDSEFSIDVTIHESDLELRFSNAVDDIESINFDKVFDLYYFADTDEENNDATGIGMYMVKKIVEQYDGTCSFYPDEDGVTLAILLPHIIAHE